MRRGGTPRAPATCEAYTASTPYIVWRELMRELLHIGWRHRRRGRASGSATSRRAAPDLVPWLPLLGDRVRTRLPPTPEVGDARGGETAREVPRDVVRFLEVDTPGPRG